MSDFEMNHGLKLETAKAKTEANKLNRDLIKPVKGINKGMNALDGFIDESEKINKLFEKYSNLIIKDMGEVDDMIDNFAEYDSCKGKTYK